MSKNVTQERIKRLEQHLKQENPVLAGCVQSFQKLDRVARKLGLMAPRIPSLRRYPGGR
ncbi:hypothetical protein [Kineobactrum salinum]|uniref:hypothetical protein n=1 Tax=Kineobactrum salinum TaxID=2708301 RepID=UPI0018D8A38C|nr:hypothetical protein [Kineobactrum salinum]